MRLIFVNPHTFAYGNPVSGLLFRKRMNLKYDFFNQFYIKDARKNVAFYVDGTRTSFNVDFPFFALGFSYLELLAWMLLNKINPLNIKVYFSIKKLNPQEDILFTFARSVINVSKRNESKFEVHKFPGLVCMHFTHYFQKIKKLSKYVERIPHCIIVAESDLTNNAFFKKYFPTVETVYQLPYALSERFIVREVDFGKRRNTCMALGTLCPVDERAFFDFFGEGSVLHPMRRILYIHHQAFPREIDSFMKGFTNVKDFKKRDEHDSFGTQLLKKTLPYMILERIIPVPQKEYFQFDIVEKYNTYKMFVCPEEIIGLPSVNVFEGMACQCAYIGIEHPMYTDLGMIPGIHYITYKENDVEDLVSRIRYYQDHPRELQAIAQQGYHFVKDNFSRKKVSEVFWDDLCRISSRFVRRGKVVVVSSFKKNGKA